MLSSVDSFLLLKFTKHPALPSLCRIWPQYVKDRIHSTYMYFAGSVGLTALSAVAVSRTPALMGLMMRGSWLVSVLTQVDVVFYLFLCITTPGGRFSSNCTFCLGLRRNQSLLGVFTFNGLMFAPLQAIGATFAAMIGAGMLVRSISYEHSPMPKHLAWMLHAGSEANYIGTLLFTCIFSQPGYTVPSCEQ